MQSRKLKYVGVNLTVAARGKSVQEPKELIKGRCIGVAFFAYGALPAQNINLSIEDTQGNPVLEAVDVRDFEKGTTGGLESYKQVDFQTNGKVYINLFSPLDIEAGVSGHFLLVIDTSVYE